MPRTLTQKAMKSLHTHHRRECPSHTPLEREPVTHTCLHQETTSIFIVMQTAVDVAIAGPKHLLHGWFTLRVAWEVLLLHAWREVDGSSVRSDLINCGH